jgi:S-adenosylmethionine:tRNA ribosyltransferase-isomerase
VHPEPFSYHLPDERIAQRPVYPPESAKMLVVDRRDGSLRHERFSDISRFLLPTDRLVFNDTRVMPARFYPHLDAPEGHQVELVLLREVADNEWIAIGYPMRRIRAATTLLFGEQLVARQLPSDTPDRIRLKFETSCREDTFRLIDSLGTMPIPPYIRKGRADDKDKIDYQSIFAEHMGSVAAPTASLHFSTALIDDIRASVGCQVDTVTLHVGAASFQPIFVNGELRPPGTEEFNASPNLIESLQASRAAGGRVIAVGTTVIRALESAVRQGADSLNTETSLFISPGFQFNIVDAVVTNFHQPSTTHLLLVESLLGKDLLTRSYETALANEYRFLSYGDGMLIL